MEHTYSYCGNCAHFEACDFIMTTYADGHGMNKCAPACGHYAIEFSDIFGNDYDLDRLRELAEADKEGRCILLPVKEGTWLGNMLYPYFKCSVCGYKMHYINIISGWAKYCPQCGAKMKQIKGSEKHE